jgi:hypothetical protein
MVEEGDNRGRGERRERAGKQTDEPHLRLTQAETTTRRQPRGEWPRHANITCHFLTHNLIVRASIIPKVK